MDLIMLKVGTFNKYEEKFNTLLAEKLKEENMTLNYFVRLGQHNNLLYPYFEGDKRMVLEPFKRRQLEVENSTIMNIIDENFINAYKVYIVRMELLVSAMENIKNDLQDKVGSDINIDLHCSSYDVHFTFKAIREHIILMDKVYYANDLINVLRDTDTLDEMIEDMFYKILKNSNQEDNLCEVTREKNLRKYINHYLYDGYGDAIKIEGNGFENGNDNFGIISTGYYLALAPDGKSDIVDNIKKELKSLVQRHEHMLHMTIRLLLKSKTDPEVKQMIMNQDFYIKTEEELVNGEYNKRYFINDRGCYDEVVFKNGVKVEEE